MRLMEPFALQLNLRTGALLPSGQVVRRRLSDMQAMFADEQARLQMQEQAGDPLVYEVYVAEVPEAEGHVLHCTTVIYPGRVGNEFFMTKGHFHSIRDRAELYLGLAGKGYMLAQTDEGKVRGFPMEVGTVTYAPPGWAHRTINTGNEPFISFAVWPGDAGHDYGKIETEGFAKILVSHNGEPILVDNPRYTGNRARRTPDERGGR